MLFPEIVKIELVAEPTHLFCGKCGFNGDVKYVYFTQAPWEWECVCFCPIPGYLIA